MTQITAHHRQNDTFPGEVRAGRFIADNFLHLFLGASMIGLGVVLGNKSVRPAAGH